LKNVNQTQYKLHGYKHISCTRFFFKFGKNKNVFFGKNRKLRKFKKQTSSFGILKTRKNGQILRGEGGLVGGIFRTNIRKKILLDFDFFGWKNMKKNSENILIL